MIINEIIKRSKKEDVVDFIDKIYFNFSNLHTYFNNINILF